MSMRRGRRSKSGSSLPNWRDYLTPEERLDVEALERNSADLATRRHRISQAIHEHRLRATARRTYALSRQAHDEAAA